MLTRDKKIRYAIYFLNFLFQLLNCLLSIAISNRPDTLFVCVNVFSQEKQLGLSEQGQQGDSYEFDFINIGDGATSLGARGSTSAVVSIENTLDG